jgi:uncharacterized protein
MLQVDAINVLERTQFVVLFGRLGGFDVGQLPAMAGPGGELFEYWAHAAALMPVSHQPLLRWKMAQTSPYGDSPGHAAHWRAWREEHAEYIDTVLAEVRDRGPLSASRLTDPRRRDGQWWARRSVGRVALEWLFVHGELAAWRTPSFERVYDLPERVFAASVLSQPTPPIEEAHRRLLLIAARSLGVATVRELASCYRIKPGLAKARLAELVEAGELAAVSVEGWPEPAYMTHDARVARPSRDQAALLSPFDSLIRDRDRARRLFGFDYTIEVYTPAPDRRFGYFVLPILLGDRLIGRLDLKADRKGSALVVAAAFVEPNEDAETAAPAVAAELDLMRRWLGLASIAVGERGDLALPLHAAVRVLSSQD